MTIPDWYSFPQIWKQTNPTQRPSLVTVQTKFCVTRATRRRTVVPKPWIYGQMHRQPILFINYTFNIFNNCRERSERPYLKDDTHSTSFVSMSKKWGVKFGGKIWW